MEQMLDTSLDQDSTEDRRGADQTLLLHAERAEIGRRIGVTGTVRVAVHTTEREQPISLDLATDGVEIEHVAIGRDVDVVPAIRQDGDTTIVSVVEEYLFVEKRLRLKEELHIRRVHGVRTHTATVTLREQHPVITRTNSDGVVAAVADVDFSPSTEG